MNITSKSDGETGVAGFGRRINAQRRLHRVHREELDHLNAYALE